MLDIIGRVFPSNYQIIFIKLILSILIIIFEISLSQIHFLYQKTPYILYTFIYFWFLEIGLMSYWVYFFIGLLYDLIFGNNLGLSTICILLLVPILTLTHPHIKNFDYTKRFLSFTIFMTLLLSLKTTFFFILFFKMPEIEFIIFQILITLIFYPLLFLFFSPIKKLINVIVREQ
tara:strand:+ start:149 stop:673 length:525 start_codon:yes stop_codon:yes gene_type:complete